MTSKALTFIAAAALTLATACGDKNRDAANELLNRSETAIEAGDYTAAIQWLDTLNARHADQIEIRRLGLALRARAMEGIALDSIQVVDRQLAESTLAVDNLAPQFRHIPAPAAGMDGYWLPKDTPANMMTATGLRARVNEDGYLQLDVNLQNKRIGLNGIRLSSGGSTWESGTVSEAGLVSVGGNESITLRQELLPGFGDWLKAHAGTVKVTYCGPRGTASSTLTAAQRASLIKAVDYAWALQGKRSAQIRREKFERMLVTARDQIANLTPAQE